MEKTVFDYIIVGAGSAGCVLADRLTADARAEVLLLEAGPKDTSPFISMPKGIGKLLTDPKYIWAFPVESKAGGPNRQEYWARGRTLGGSSSVNGMMYVRGEPAEYDSWEAMGATGWNWKTFAAAFKAIEDYQVLAGQEERGRGGPLHVSVETHPHRGTQAFLQAGAAAGLKIKADVNGYDIEGIGVAPATIRRGRRCSAADAFLKPALSRRNLTVVTEAEVGRVIFEGQKAVGVECTVGGQTRTYKARREVILSAGGIQSPKILQLSGIGPGDVLQAAGVPVVVDRPAVGRHLREHRVLYMQYRIKDPRFSRNNELKGLGLMASVLKYYLFKTGIMSIGAFEGVAFVRSRPELTRCDGQIFFSPLSLDLDALNSGKPVEMDALPGMQCIAYPLKPISEGFLEIRSAQPADPLRIQPNFLAEQADKDAAIGTARFVRKIFSQPPLADITVSEINPGADIQSDEEILAAFDRTAVVGYHAVGTCRIGGEGAVVDPRLRVRGVKGLRVVDLSVFPTVASGNTNGPTSALAWQAAKLIREDNAHQ